jgi:hypothetical protein
VGDSDRSGPDHKWDEALEAAILELLGEIGKADVQGLLHVLQRERLRLDNDDLSRALARLSKQGRVRIQLDEASKSPVVELHHPFVGWQ